MTSQFTYPILNTNLVFIPCPTAPHTTLNQFTFDTSVLRVQFLFLLVFGNDNLKGLSLL